MTTLSRKIWSGRYGVVGFDQNGGPILGKKVLTPQEEGQKAARDFKEQLEKDLLEVGKIVAKVPGH